MESQEFLDATQSLNGLIEEYKGIENDTGPVVQDWEAWVRETTQKHISKSG
jgi:hypothetical protein